MAIAVKESRRLSVIDKLKLKLFKWGLISDLNIDLLNKILQNHKAIKLILSWPYSKRMELAKQYEGKILDYYSEEIRKLERSAKLLEQDYLSAVEEGETARATMLLKDYSRVKKKLDISLGIRDKVGELIDLLRSRIIDVSGYEKATELIGDISSLMVESTKLSQEDIRKYQLELQKKEAERIALAKEARKVIEMKKATQEATSKLKEAREEEEGKAEDISDKKEGEMVSNDKK